MSKRVMVGISVALLATVFTMWLAFQESPRPEPRSVEDEPGRVEDREPRPRREAPAQTAATTSRKDPERPWRSGTTIEQLYARLAPAVPVVTAVGVGSGSGFLVERNGEPVVVTNRHVVRSSHGRIELRFPLGAKRSGSSEFVLRSDRVSVAAIHKVADLALLRVRTTMAELAAAGISPWTVAPGDREPRTGAKVYAIGHPGASDGTTLLGTLTEGLVSAVDRVKDGARQLQVTVDVNPGNSGGPVFNETGEVLGVVAFSYRRSPDGVPLEGLNFAVAALHVRELLASPGAALSADEMDAELRAPHPRIALAGLALARELSYQHESLVRAAYKLGYAPAKGSIDDSTEWDAIDAGTRAVTTIYCRPRVLYAVGVSSVGTKRLQLKVINLAGEEIVKQANVDGRPIAVFSVTAEGQYSVVVDNNATSDRAIVGIAMFVATK